MTDPSTTELKSFAEMAERFAKKELAPRAIELDNYPFRGFNRAALAAARATGLLGVVLPEEYGGVGQGMAALGEALFALAREDASFAAVVLFDSLARSLLVKAGAKPFVEKSAAALVGLPAYDPPSDPQRGLAAAATNGGYTLAGKVEYVALAPVAGALVLPARLLPEDRIGYFLVETAAAGVRIGAPVVSLGLRGCPVADVECEGVPVGGGNLLLGDDGAAYAGIAAAYKSAVAAMAAGVAAGSFAAAKAYTRERYQGGRMIIEYDMVRQMLAGLALAAESGRALARSMAAAADAGEAWPLSETLILVTEQASRAATDGVQCLGGYGYMEDYGQEKRMRDAKQIQNIFGPTPLRRLDFLAEILRREG
jgi:alkylation response protein AidB-like acyl-CoA dehydrogenase